MDGGDQHDTSNLRIFRRYKEMDVLDPLELEPFGISESETSAKVSAASVKNCNQFMLNKPSQPWISRLVDEPSIMLHRYCNMYDNVLISAELQNNADLIGEPLKEVDPHYMGKGTYITVTREGSIARFPSSKSIGLFSPNNEIRKSAIAICNSEYFICFIIAVIILDFLSLVLEGGSDDVIVKLGAEFFFAIYTSEMVIKIIASGLVLKKHSYLRDFYSIIEATVVISSIIPLLVSDADMLSQLRVIRVLRLIRILGSLTWTRKILDALACSFKDLIPVFTLFFLAVSFVSLISLIFFRGTMLSKCVLDMPATTIEQYINQTNDPQNWGVGNWGARRCPVIYRDRLPWTSILDDRYLRSCPDSYSCHLTRTGNPDMGFSNYDTYIMAMLTTFRLFCQDWWDNMFVQLSLINGGHFSSLYFLVLILFLSHFIINLLLSTITLAFEQHENAAKAEDEDAVKLGVIIEVNRNPFLYRQIEIFNILSETGRKGIAEPIFLKNLPQNPNLKVYESVHTTAIALIQSFHTEDQLESSSNSDLTKKRKHPLHFIVCSLVKRDDPDASIPIDQVANTVILMNIIEMIFSAPPHPMIEELSKYTNLCYTTIFVFEALVKLHVLKLKFVSATSNQFDLFIALTCLLELLIPGSYGKMLMLLRMTRLLRLLKLARISKELEKLLTVIIRSFMSELSLIMISSIVIIISAGIGMVLFQDTYKKHKYYQRPTWNFVDFLNSILVVFRIMCGEWVENLWVCMKLVETPIRKGFCVVYFLMNQVIVSLVIFQLYIGILLNKFSEYRAEEAGEAEEKKEKSNWTKYISEKISPIFNALHIEPSENTAIGRFRIAIREVCCAKSSRFGWFIVLATLLSSTALILDDFYLSSDPQLTEIYKHLEVIFLLIFTIEMLLKLIAYGPVQYVCSAWRLLDAAIVIISIFDIVLTYAFQYQQANFAVLRVFRTLRCLRIMRTANLWEGFKLTINALFKSLRKLVFVVLIVLIVWLMFALVSTSLFSNRFHRCVDEQNNTIDNSIVSNESDCYKQGMHWRGQKINFDSTHSAMLALLEIAIFKGWTDIFQYISNIADNNYGQPNIDSNSSPKLLIYVCFIFIGSFFMLGMLVGVIVDSFEEERRVLSNEVMTEGQKKLQNTVMNCLIFPVKSKKPKPDNKVGILFYKINEYPAVETFYLFLILLSTVILTLKYHPGKSEFNHFYLPVIENIILFIFGVELVTRILGEDRAYFAPLIDWNTVDFLIVFLSLAAEISVHSVQIQYLRVIRLSRIFRMGRFLSKWASVKAVRNILLAVVVTLPNMLNIIALLIMAMCIFAIVGVNLFNDQKRNEEHPFNEMFNFRSFIPTWRMLFIVSTSAGFNDYLHASMEFDGIFAKLAVGFWVFYLVSSFFILTNLMVSAVVSSYTNVFDDQASMVRLDTAEMLINVWNDFDVNCEGFISIDLISHLLSEIGEPLRVPKPNSAIVSKLCIPLNEEYKVEHIDLVRQLICELMKHSGEISEGDTSNLEPNEEDKNESDGVVFNSKIYGKLCLASDYVKYCWWRKKFNPINQQA